MSEIWQFIQAHPLFLPVGMYVVSSFVSNMPEPDSDSGKGYKWLYGSLHAIVGNIGNVIQAAKAGKEGA